MTSYFSKSNDCSFGKSWTRLNRTSGLTFIWKNTILLFFLNCLCKSESPITLFWGPHVPRNSTLAPFHQKPIVMFWKSHITIPNYLSHSIPRTAPHPSTGNKNKSRRKLNPWIRTSTALQMPSLFILSVRNGDCEAFPRGSQTQEPYGLGRMNPANGMKADFRHFFYGFFYFTSLFTRCFKIILDEEQLLTSMP
ncbi:hypothetical protein Nepgr_015570 [Nepenthes gracilis]|uniref:Uncharacterized protein n=1 Tax=Nepenthes gracilis TaxID=150966 RepID=A0AAD3SN11_NEPGR|nr:hypothetical protein Nepgr_015570 [Nepenthes gracilis]